MARSGDSASDNGPSKHTAWVLDDSVAAASDGAHIPGVPGLWRHGAPVSPEAFGMGVKEFRKIVEKLALPLKEVRVTESLSSFERGDEPARFESADAMAALAPVQASTDPEAADVAEEVVQGGARATLETTLERAEAASGEGETDEGGAGAEGAS